jgi:hypothetical protein
MHRQFLSLASLLLVGAAEVGGPVHSSGTQVDCDLPAERHQRNAGGADGSGLCVFTSIGMAADWCSEDALVGFRDWMRSRPGGGYPEKVTAMIRAICQERRTSEPRYLQLQGGDLDLIARAVQQGHLACVTYSKSPTGRYAGRPIAHMVNCVAARAGPHKLWAVLDNNFPGSFEWMSEEEFRATYTMIGGGWTVLLLRHGPPPPPRTR